jgi:hypothetical protein
MIQLQICGETQIFEKRIFSVILLVQLVMMIQLLTM